MGKSNIVLIGLPGSGKTTIGKSISFKLGIPFLDTDSIIEETACEKIEQIFANKGEKEFRALERDVVKKTSHIKNIVISSGGGAWLDGKNRENLRNTGTVVYLKCDLGEAWSRLENSHKERPLLKAGFQSLERLFYERHVEYEKADLIIETSGRDVKSLTSEIIEKTGIANKNTTTASQEEIEVNIPGGSSYRVIIGSKVLMSLPDILEKHFCDINKNKPRLFIVTNPYIKALCGRRFFKGLQEAGFESFVHIIPEGEEHKNLLWAERSYSCLAEEGFDRGDIILALGGGVIGDLAGFIASTYMRGVSLVQIPTTLLAQVDSSIGGKTGVNLPQGKNLVGAFYQPEIVTADLDILQHLSDYDYRQGLAECVKYALLSGEDFLNFFEDNIDGIRDRNAVVLREMIARCCRMKGEIVEKDEKEKGLRAILNLGHTIGHALEASLGYGRIGHGDAVALGIKAEAHLSAELGRLSPDSLERIETVLAQLSFPDRMKFTLDEAMDYLSRDKKRSRGEDRFALPVDGGRVELMGGIDPFLIKKAFEYVEG